MVVKKTSISPDDSGISNSTTPPLPPPTRLPASVPMLFSRKLKPSSVIRTEAAFSIRSSFTKPPASGVMPPQPPQPLQPSPLHDAIRPMASSHA
jgi:hypothetical protein